MFDYNIKKLMMNMLLSLVCIIFGACGYICGYILFEYFHNHIHLIWR